jgi:capsular polysaccharide biosynthesis protein
MAIDYLKILKDEKRLVVTITCGALILSLILSIIQPFQYSAKTRLLVIPAAGGVDTYSALKSAEKIGENLSQIIHTTSFFDKVTRENSELENKWSQNEKKRRKQWEKTVETEVIYGTGMVDATVYHKNKSQAVLLAKSVSDVLSREGRNYFGMAGLQIIMVSSPLASSFPVRPNILLNALMGLVLGFLAAIAYTLLTYHPAMAGYKKPIFVKEEPKMRFEEEEKDDENEEIRSMYEDKKF